MSDTYIQQSIEQRRHRQKRIHDGDMVLDVIHPEPALHLRVGDAGVMAEQLNAMADLCALPNVTVRVVTYDAGQYEARRLGMFAILSHPWATPQVQIEGYGGGRLITTADEVSYFRAAYDQGIQAALPPDESISFIRNLADQWETKQ